MNTGTTLETPCAQQCLQDLMRIWFDFERSLGRIKPVSQIMRGTMTRQDYLRLLLHLRQQVVEGSRWITRCASSFDRDHAEIRNMIIAHAGDEHRDYEMLERDYEALGGDPGLIRGYSRNPGSEALHGYLMYRAGQPNPAAMLGAMWIIEGLGRKMATDWAQRIDEQTGGDGSWTTFMRYHGENDENHMQRFYVMLDRLCRDTETAKDIALTAHVVSALYALQLDYAGREES